MRNHRLCLAVDVQNGQLAGPVSTYSARRFWPECKAVVGIILPIQNAADRARPNEVNGLPAQPVEHDRGPEARAASKFNGPPAASQGRFEPVVTTGVVHDTQNPADPARGSALRRDYPGVRHDRGRRDDRTDPRPVRGSGCAEGRRSTQSRRVASSAHRNALVPGFSSPRRFISIRSGSTVRLSSAAGRSAKLN